MNFSLRKRPIFLNFRGDKDAIERIAYEKCQDQAENGVIYFEARYSPHLLCNTASHYVWHMDTIYKEKGPVCFSFL